MWTVSSVTKLRQVFYHFETDYLIICIMCISHFTCYLSGVTCRLQIALLPLTNAGITTVNVLRCVLTRTTATTAPAVVATSLPTTATTAQVLQLSRDQHAQWTMNVDYVNLLFEKSKMVAKNKLWKKTKQRDLLNLTRFWLLSVPTKELWKSVNIWQGGTEQTWFISIDTDKNVTP